VRNPELKPQYHQKRKERILTEKQFFKNKKRKETEFFHVLKDSYRTIPGKRKTSNSNR
jgi:ribosomal protein RSM22 (predicted rRNA methylase)